MKLIFFFKKTENNEYEHDFILFFVAEKSKLGERG